MVTKVKGGVLDESALSGKNMTGDIAFNTTTLKIDSSNNRVGIGTASPAVPLDVAGNFILKSPANTLYGNFDATTQAYAAFRLQAAGSNYGFIGQTSSLLTSGGSNTALGLRSENEFVIATGGATERMRIDSSGNVGIGTSSPSGTLDVQAANAGQGIRLTATTGTNGAQYKATTGAGNLYMGIDTSSGGSFGKANSAVLWYDAAQPMVFATNNAEKMRIDSSGNVGIGTSSPATWAGNLLQTGTKSLFGQLDTNSAAYIVNNIAYDGSNWKYVTNGTASIYAQDHSDSNAHVWYTIASGTAGNNATLNQRMKLTSTGSFFLHNIIGFSGANSDVRYDTSSGQIYYQTSSQRYKSEITDLEDSLNKIESLRPVRFKDNYTEEFTTGLIAEEVVDIIPEVVFKKDIDGFDTPQPEGINYSDITPFLIKAIQEQQTIIEDLKSRIEILEG